MDFETAMDPMTTISVVNAKRELLSHGFPSYIEGGYIYAEIEDTEIEETMVCQVVDSEVYSSELLRWLGY